MRTLAEAVHPYDRSAFAGGGLREGRSRAVRILEVGSLASRVRAHSWETGVGQGRGLAARGRRPVAMH
jgi:hypothetical protein